MAMNWIAAFKLIPWADMAAAAPGILKGAKGLWSRTKKTGAQDDITEAGFDGSIASVNRLAARINELEAEQRTASDLINALAEQNAQLVAAVAVLRTRTRALLALFALGALAIIVLWLR